MDYSPEYRKMCDTPEIQKLSHYDDGNYFAFFVSGEWQKPFVFSYGHMVPYEQGDYAVWLPAQSQLQEMAWRIGAGYSNLVYLLKDFYNFLEKSYGDKRIDGWLPDPTDVFTSMEQLWLAFTMREKNKVWDNGWVDG